MGSRLRRLGRDLTGRSDWTLIDHVLGQLRTTHEGVVLARATARAEVDAAHAREQIADIEHRGDVHRRELVAELSAALAPPMDREDLYRFSRSVDDVLDNLRDLVREMDLYDIDEEPLLDEPLAGVERGVESLIDAVEAVLAEPDRSRSGAREAKKNDIRPSYQRAMAGLLAGDEPITGLVLRRRELLRRVDVVGLRLAEAADVLADGAVKRSH